MIVWIGGFCAILKIVARGLAWHYGVFACGFLEGEKHEEREDSVGEGNGCKERVVNWFFIAD